MSHVTVDASPSARYRSTNPRQSCRGVVEFFIEESSGKIGPQVDVPTLTNLGRISSTELHRRVWHILPGLIPFVDHAVHHQPGGISLQSRVVMISLATGLSAFVLSAYHTIAREGERNRHVNLVSYWAVSLLLLLLFPTKPMLAVVVFIVQSFGDGLATLMGLLFGRRRLPWNTQKTWVGSAAFLVSSAPLAALGYWQWSEPGVSLGIAALCGSGAALIAMLIESLPSQFPDNLRVNLAAAAGILVLHSMLVGWP